MQKRVKFIFIEGFFYVKGQRTCDYAHRFCFVAELIRTFRKSDIN